jgi:hypothetical protein
VVAVAVVGKRQAASPAYTQHPTSKPNQWPMDWHCQPQRAAGNGQRPSATPPVAQQPPAAAASAAASSGQRGESTEGGGASHAAALPWPPWGSSEKHRCMEHGAWHGGRPKNNPGNKKQSRGACCYLLRWRWANNPLALPSKYPIPADLSIAIADPTCLIAETLARR